MAVQVVQAGRPRRSRSSARRGSAPPASRGPRPGLDPDRALSSERVLFGARACDRDAAGWGIERMRFALGIDQDLEPFYERFRFDPLIGHAVRANPRLRVAGRPDPFEALAGRSAAADRVRARGRDPAAADREARPSLPGIWAAGCADGGGAGRTGAGAAGLVRSAPAPCLDARQGRAGGRRRTRRPRSARSRAGLAAAAADQRDRQLDDSDAGADRPGAPRPAPGRRSRVSEAGRPPAGRW